MTHFMRLRFPTLNK
ncbi:MULTISPECIES: erythromycin resistance leader peptide [Bacillales]|nr:erythromycin resistance leader peptide [Peribacillus asahii]